LSEQFIFDDKHSCGSDAVQSTKKQYMGDDEKIAKIESLNAHHYAPWKQTIIFEIGSLNFAFDVCRFPSSNLLSHWPVFAIFQIL
jgi:hypothetical protein